jgi:hypothetical protein
MRKATIISLIAGILLVAGIAVSHAAVSQDTSKASSNQQGGIIKNIKVDPALFSQVKSPSQTALSFANIEPPSWAGAATGESAGIIKVRWHLSTDPQIDHYVIFSSTVSGSYDWERPVYVTDDNQVIGVNFEFPLFLSDIPLYFVVAGADTQSNIGEPSPETWAIAYTNPESAQGTIFGEIIDSQSQQGIAQASIDLYYITGFNADNNGAYSFTYYPGFYWATASHPSYLPQSQPVQIIANQGGEYDFTLEDNGLVPDPITGLGVEPDNGFITLNWDLFDDKDNDFKHFNIYRETNPIVDVTGLSPMDESITDSTTTFFIDNTITNGIDYYYAVVAEDLAGNFNPQVQDAGPAHGNSAPKITNLTAYQQGNIVQISYDLADAENSTVEISFQYWDGQTWQETITTTGEGSQIIGIGKIGTWDAKQDWPDFEGISKIKVIADDGEAVHNSTEAESPEFTLDTKDPIVEITSPVLGSIIGDNNPLLEYQIIGGQVYETLIDESATVEPLDSGSPIGPLADGLHQVEVRAQDPAENQGSDAVSFYVFTVPPEVIIISSHDSIPQGTANIELKALATDTFSAIAQARYYYIDVDSKRTPAQDGFPMDPQDGNFDNLQEEIFATVDTQTWVPEKSPYTIYVEAQDAAGNWSEPDSVEVKVIPDFYLTGPAPGVAGQINVLELTGATPDTWVRFVYGFRSGATEIPGCPEIAFDIKRPKFLGFAKADKDGKASRAFFVPGLAAGKTVLFQAFEASNCQLSNLVIHTFEEAQGQEAPPLAGDIPILEL